MKTHAERLQGALTKLGAEKVKQGCAAFSDPMPNGWNGCFLARCYGPFGALVRDAGAQGKLYSDLLDLDPDEMWAVASEFDCNPDGLKATVNEFLGQHEEAACV